MFSEGVSGGLRECEQRKILTFAVVVPEGAAPRSDHQSVRAQPAPPRPPLAAQPL